LRIFKRSIAPAAARLSAAGDDRKRIANLMRDYACKAALGRQRAFVKLERHFAPTIVERLKM
jgi:hypothetical protein